MKWKVLAPRYEIFLVQASFKLLEPEDAQKLLDRFYAKLFELDPKLEALFMHSHMDEQKKKLGALLTAGIESLHDFPDEIKTALRGLGERHIKYGVKDDDYETVGSALVFAITETFCEMLGETPETMTDLLKAWGWVYQMLAQVMNPNLIK